MKPSIEPEDMAKRIWETYSFYWIEESELIQQQKITHNIIAEIVRVLRMYGIEDLDYWNKVGIEIYRINDKHN